MEVGSRKSEDGRWKREVGSLPREMRGTSYFDGVGSPKMEEGRGERREVRP
jgi:hypothetical protein